MNTTILEQAEQYVAELFSKELNSQFVYHNLAHTQRVVDKVNELAELSNLDDKNRMLLTLAAWFHDTGFINTVKGHEKESVKIAQEFLKEQNLNEEDIETISRLILATEFDRKPETELECFIKDADCAHVSSKDYESYAALLKKEWDTTTDTTYTNVEWLENNIDFINNHKYYSTTANIHWGEIKSKNLASLLKKKAKRKRNAVKVKQKAKQIELKKRRVELPERGVETMFRVALKNHITLSDIADTKANILLSVNAVIISVALSGLLPKLDNPSNSYLIYPTLIFLVFTVICIVLSVLATRPNVTKGEFTKEDVANKKVNILFFGNFHQMSFEDFDWAMQEVMEDKRYLYGSLTKDLYYLGLVLNRKYNLLRITYTVFMIGIVFSVIAFGIAFSLSDSMQGLPTD